MTFQESDKNITFCFFSENGQKHRYELQVGASIILHIEENADQHLGFVVTHSNPEFCGKTINAQQVIKQVQSKKSKHKSVSPPPGHKCPIQVCSQNNVEAVYVDFQDSIFGLCYGGVVEGAANSSIFIKPVMVSTKETDDLGNRKSNLEYFFDPASSLLLSFFVEIGLRESAREIKLTLFPIPQDLYEDIRAGKQKTVDISKEMKEARWQESIQFLSYVRPER